MRGESGMKTAEMNVFISHKKEDGDTAQKIYNEFQHLGVKSYLDLVDNSIKGGKELTEHIKKHLNSCTDIIVVMSSETKKSWWVPFEIGMSAQVDMPTASFLKSDVALPEYLQYWPRLKFITDIATYVNTRSEIGLKMLYEHFDQRSNRALETSLFYDELKKKLR